MVRALRVVVTALCVLTLVGCATSSPIPLKLEAFARIQSTRAHIAIPQEEINVEVVRSTSGAAAAGILGALIDVSVEANRANKANLMIEPVRKQLADLDFRAEFDKKFRAALVDLPALKINQAEVTSQPYSVETLSHLRSSTPQDSLLTMSVDYKLSSDYRILIVSGLVTLWQRGQEEAQYLGSYRYFSAPISSKSGETAVRAWANNNAESIRAALREGLSETIRMLKLDFVPKADTDQGDALLGEDGKLKVVSVKTAVGRQKGGVTTSRVNELASKILAKDNDRIIFRAKAAGNLWVGNRYTVPGEIYSTTTRQRFEAPDTAPSAVSSGKAKP